MSQWTHVTGSIRFNSLGWVLDHTRNVRKTIRSAFNKNIPTGSEGKLRFTLIQTGYQDEHGGTIEWGTICFHSNLRDYSDYESIFNWLKESCNSLLPMEDVRDAAIVIDVEYKGKYFIYFDSESETLVMKEIK